MGLHPISPGTKIDGTRLTVVSAQFYHTMPNGKKRIAYVFKCDCGHEKYIQWRHIKHPTVSCGCRQKEIAKERAEKLKIIPRLCRLCKKSEFEVTFPDNRSLGHICKECSVIYDKRRRDNKPKDIELNHITFLKKLYRSTLRQRNKTVSISIDDLISLWELQGGKCAITGLAMRPKHKSPYAISIDRKNSKLGYVAGNCHLVCVSINYAKHNFEESVFTEFLKELLFPCHS